MTNYGYIHPEFKQRWVEALRSGTYPQALNALVNKDEDFPIEYCCIAVGAVVAGASTEELLGHGDTDIAARKCGLTAEAQQYLVDLNDNEEKDFNYIASWIEENL